MAAAILKSIFCVLAFIVSVLVIVPISLLYGFVITAVAGIGFSICMGIAASAFFVISGGRIGGGNYPMEAVAFLAFFIAAGLLLIIVVISGIVFLVGPFWITSKNCEFDQAVLTAQRQKISHLSQIVAERMGQVPFDNIVEVSGFYVGAISTFLQKTLVIDPKILDHLSKNEVTTLIAHEYGHFGNGRSFCYIFLRYCQLAANFVSSQIDDDSENTVFHRLIRWTLAIVPKFFKMPEILRAIILHVSHIIVKFYSFATNLVIRLFRTEFYQAEIWADKQASTIVSPSDVCGALVRLSALQLYMSLDRKEKPQLFLERWQAFARKHTITHPSIKYRLGVLGSENLDDYSGWIKTLMDVDQYSLVKNVEQEYYRKDADRHRSVLKFMSFSQVVGVEDT